MEETNANQHKKLSWRFILNIFPTLSLLPLNKGNCQNTTT